MSENRSRRPNRGRRQGGGGKRVFADDASGGFHSHLEQLEERRLLAVTVSNDNLAAFLTDGGYRFKDDTSITVAADTLIEAGTANIVFEAPIVEIGEAVQLKTTGDVTITAKKTTENSPNSLTPLWGQLTTLIDAWRDMSVGVTIDSGATIEAGSLTIDAVAGDTASTILKDLSQIPGVGQLAQLGENILGDLTSLPLSFQWKQPAAAVDFRPGASVTTTGDVSIKAEATADATGQAIWSVVADYLVKERKGWQQGGSRGGGLAVGFSYSDSQATATIGGNVSIAAGGELELHTSTTTTASMSSRVTLNQGLQQTNPNNIEVAFAGTLLKSTSKIDVAAGAELAAMGRVSIEATGADTNKISSSTASYRDGLVGAAGGLGWSYGTVEVNVNGAVTAGHVDIPDPVVFAPLFAVDFATNSLRLPEATSFVTGDEVKYQTDGGGAIPGLTADAVYYAIVDPANPRQLQLAATRADARAGEAIPLRGHPTLRNSRGTLPITRVETLVSDTLLFDTTAWPDGSPLFVDGEVVSYTPLAGQFLGVNDATGTLVGDLPVGNYRVRLVPLDAETPGLAVQLLPADTADADLATATAVDLNDNPVFVRADGSFAQVASFDADAGQVSFNFPRPEPGASEEANELARLFPEQTVELVNAEPLTYRAGFGTRVDGLVDGVTYYAIVDPDTPGVIALAESATQAASADPGIQLAVPTLTVGADDDERLVPIGNVEPGVGLVFSSDPGLTAGTPVVYNAVAGKPVGGLADGETYYAYPQTNPFFDADLPQYVVGPACGS